MFEATLRSGAVWTGDAVLLKTLPQGEAKLATLTVRELVVASKATAKVKAKAKGEAEEERHSEEGEEAKSAAKKPKSIRQMLEAGASEHLKPVPHGTEGVSNDAGIVYKEALGEPKTSKRRRIENVPGMEIGAGEHVVQNSAEATKAGADLFPQTDGNDHASIKWLQTQEADARCRSLLHQIRQWTGKETTEHMRSLARAQGIKVTRQQKSIEKIRQAVRQHFEAAIAQEKRRLEFFCARLKA